MDDQNILVVLILIVGIQHHTKNIDKHYLPLDKHTGIKAKQSSTPALSYRLNDITQWKGRMVLFFEIHKILSLTVTGITELLS